MLSNLSCSLSSINSSLTSDDASSDDEIVWGVSEDSTSSSDISTETSISLASDDDFIVLRSYGESSSDSGASTPSVVENVAPPDAIAELASGLSRLSLEHRQTPINKVVSKSTNPQPSKQKKKSRPGAKARAASTILYAYPSPAPSPPITKHSLSTSRTTTAQPCIKVHSIEPGKARRAKKAKKHKKVAATANTGLGARPIVDDASEMGQEDSTISISMYDEAVRYISVFLSNPAESSASRLTLLQSLIIELGLCNPRSCSVASTSLLPSSLTAAKAYLKSRAFLNIRDYLAVRDKGQAALQKVMHPSRSALIRDIRKKGNPASLKWVKEHGLQVLLVTCQ